MATLAEQAPHLPGTAAAPLSACRPARWEWLAVLFMLAGFFVFNLGTCAYYPNVWCDEVWFSEPSVNCVLHGSLTTTTWPLQPGGTFPAVNCPLYFLTQVPWLNVMGTSLVAIRSFNYTLMALACFLLWVVSWRFGLVLLASSRLWLIIAAHLGAGMSLAYRSSRPDMLGLVCLLLLLLAFQVSSRPLRVTCLVLLSAVTVWIGLQVALYAGFACALAWLVLRRTNLGDLLALAIGIAGGLASMLWFLSRKGVLWYFLTMVARILPRRLFLETHLLPLTQPPSLQQQLPGVANSPPPTIHDRIPAVALDCLKECVNDLGTSALIVALLVLLFFARARIKAETRRILAYCLILALGTPMFFSLLRHYNPYYCYTKFLPAALAAFGGWSALIVGSPPFDRRSRRLRVLCGVALAAVVLAGLPLRLTETLVCAQVHPRTEIQHAIAPVIGPRDTVLCEHGGLFETKKVAGTVYDLTYSASFYAIPWRGGHDFTPEEKRSINVLVLRPERAGFATNYFGGQWTAVSTPFGDTQDLKSLYRLPLLARKILHPEVGFEEQREHYSLQIFRKTQPEPADRKLAALSRIE